MQHEDTKYTKGSDSLWIDVFVVISFLRYCPYFWRVIERLPAVSVLGIVEGLTEVSAGQFDRGISGCRKRCCPHLAGRWLRKMYSIVIQLARSLALPVIFPRPHCEGLSTFTRGGAWRQHGYHDPLGLFR